MFFKAGVLALASAGLLLFAQPALAKGSQTYEDATGENAAAADISLVKVENDDAGKLVFSVSFNNMPTFAADAALFIALDVDRNARTGDRGGAEYVFVLDGSDNSYGFVRWTGSTYEQVQSANLRVMSGPGVAVVELNRSDIGGVNAFDFYTWSLKGPAGSEVGDDAPDGTAAWTYELKFAPVIESVVATAQPAQPKAGKTFALSVQAELADQQVVKPTSVRCTAKLAGKTIKGTGPGGCRWKLPKNAKGKKLVVTVTVTYQDAAPVTASTTYRVR